MLTEHLGRRRRSGRGRRRGIRGGLRHGRLLIEAKLMELGERRGNEGRVRSQGVPINENAG
ncbi:MAG TPA: hypothetical protein DCQ98_00080 [Planctomycetaceae bacterium]|nr:hypothetical protein [Planctomycetaceae bacterium]